MTAEKNIDRVLLVHILECIDRIQTYTCDGREAFFNSRLVQDAVARNLQTLAEWTQRLSTTLESGERDVRWKAIAGFRNVFGPQISWLGLRNDLGDHRKPAYGVGTGCRTDVSGARYDGRIPVSSAGTLYLKHPQATLSHVRRIPRRASKAFEWWQSRQDSSKNSWTRSKKHQRCRAQPDCVKYCL